MPATHFRIARELLPLLDISDPQKYFAGTLYPDARYMTGLSRDQTHGKNCPQHPFQPGLTDFEKGWGVHLLYDEISGEKQKALMPPGLVLSQTPDSAWAHFTAIKIVEDLFSARALGKDLSELATTTAEEAPQNESLIQLRRYYNLFEYLYGSGLPTTHRYLEYFFVVRIENEITLEIMSITENLRRDNIMRPKIGAIYADSLQEIHDRFPQSL